MDGRNNLLKQLLILCATNERENLQNIYYRNTVSNCFSFWIERLQEKHWIFTLTWKMWPLETFLLRSVVWMTGENKILISQHASYPWPYHLIFSFLTKQIFVSPWDQKGICLLYVVDNIYEKKKQLKRYSCL